MVDCLRTKTIDELQSVSYQVPDYLTSFGPIIDGIVVPSEPRVQLHNIRQSQQRTHATIQPSVLTSASTSSSSSSSATLSASTNSWSHFHHRIHHHTTSWSQPTQTVYPDLLIGVTSAEVLPMFSAHEERNGISVARRDRILRTLVRNLFDYHQQVRDFHLLTDNYQN